jgi:hypothetical protein
VGTGQKFQNGGNNAFCLRSHHAQIDLDKPENKDQRHWSKTQGREIAPPDIKGKSLWFQ